MDISEFLHAPAFAENDEVIEARLPDVAVGQCPALRTDSRTHPAKKASSESLFQSLHHDGGISAFGFAQQQVDMFGHHHVAGDDKVIAPAHLLQHFKKQVAI